MDRVRLGTIAPAPGDVDHVEQRADVEPVGGGAPDAAALAAPGIELVSAGTARHSSAGGRSVAHASGPILRVTSPDGRVVTLVLGEASADAQLERVG